MHRLALLPVSERINLVQELWDSIGQSQDELPLQDWHRELVKSRLADLDNHSEESTLSRKQLWQQVKKQRDS